MQHLNSWHASSPQGVPPVTRTFNTLMIACNTSGQWQQALEVHREMRAGGHALNTTSYNALISAHSKSGHLDQVLATYRSMVEEVCAPTLTASCFPTTDACTAARPCRCRCMSHVTCPC